jgi:hypothetical protein
MSLWDQFKETASKAAKIVAETATEAKNLAAYQLKLREVRSQINQATESQRADFESMGRRVYEMHKAGQISDSTLLAGCTQIDASYQKIEELHKAEEHMKAEYEALKAKDESQKEAPPPGGETGQS